ncbi:MAG TPA: hypothetical protein VFB06_10710 [Streptosporangiaceae bacterium]|nr:hypothetical protein [Streptosporangiaceae bacterium]
MRLVRKTTMLAVIAGLAAAGAAIPATAHADGGNGGGVTPPSNGGGGTPGYSTVVQGNVTISGQPAPSRGVNEVYKPPECWLQPWFKQPNSWAQGDPALAGNAPGAPDADSFWWYMARRYPGMMFLIAHVPDARDEINNDFKMVQQGQNDDGSGAVGADWVWWAPNWLSSSAGWACAQNMVASAGMNNGFLDLEPPAKPAAGAGFQISPQNLAALARAALKLPDYKIVTDPGTAPGTTAYVNTATKVYLQFNGPKDPWDLAQAKWMYGTYLWAKIATTGPTVQIQTNDPGAKVGYDGKDSCLQATPCTITFAGPSTTGNPFTITVTATWTVSWTSSAGTGGTFTNPPPIVQQTRTIVVREIQSINN